MKTRQLPILKKVLLVLIPGIVILFSFLPLPNHVFPVIYSLLLLFWGITFIVEGAYRITDIPILFLMAGTFSFGRAFSILNIEIKGIPLFITEAMLAIALGLLLFRGKKLFKEWSAPMPKGLIIPLAVYFLIGVVYMAVGVNGNGTAALRDLVFCFYMPFFFITLSLLRKTDRFKKLVPYFFPFAIVAMFVGLIYTFLRIPRASAFADFITNNIKMFNLCLYLGLIFIFGVGFFGYIKGRLKLPLYLTIHFALLFIIMVEVRAAWLGILVAIFFLGVLMVVKNEYKVFLLLVLTIALSIYLVGVFDLGIRKNRTKALKEQVVSVAHRSPRSMAGANIKWRFGIWRQTWEHIVEHPVFGWGYGIQIDYIQWKKSLSLLKARHGGTGVLPAHNHLLAITYKMGFVGVLVFLIINIWIFIYGLSYIEKCKSEFNQRFLISILAGLLLWHGMALFFDVLESPPTSIFLWIMLGAVVGLVHVDRNEKITAAEEVDPPVLVSGK